MKIQDQLKLLDKVKKRIKSSDTIKKIFKEANLGLDVIDLVPMCFADLEVSARTQHGIIYFNKELINNQDQIDHYMVHELTHILQQCFSDQPTMGSNADNYLDNPYEQEGFKNQTKFITETEGKEEAAEYINKVLEHHDVPDKEKEDKKDALLSYAADDFKQKSEKRKKTLDRLIQALYTDEDKKLSSDDRQALLDHVNLLSEDEDYRKEYEDFMKSLVKKTPEELLREQIAREAERKRIRDAIEGTRNILEVIERSKNTRGF